MKESEVETIVQRAREQFPGERPRIISDNGPQFVTKDLKEYILTSTPTDISCRVVYHLRAPIFPQFLPVVRLALTLSPQSDIWGLCLPVNPKS